MRSVNAITLKQDGLDLAAPSGFPAEGHEMVLTKGQVVPIVGFAYCTKPQQALISHLAFSFSA